MDVCIFIYIIYFLVFVFVFVSNVAGSFKREERILNFAYMYVVLLHRGATTLVI